MSARVRTEVVCDGCGWSIGGGSVGVTAAQHRRDYAPSGWHYSHGTDYCPECARKRFGERSREIRNPTNHQKK